ncbi:ligand-binding sensor domain-containing protein [Rhodothermus marinus]|uniref:ligand-binding sensor domain-containing protein n=1 Tax=Rhodothermus marinus TaxID=29549 RepID=UPI000A52451C|nr:two-component regulator propeller domain-containing protein [Rhodothermus marinus]
MVGTDAGLSRYLPAQDAFHNYRPGDGTGFQGGAVQDLIEDARGYLWVASTNGLYRFDPEREAFAHYAADPESPTGLSHTDVRALLIDSRGNFWVATAGGLDRFDPATGVFEHFRHDPRDPRSLPHDVLFDLVEDAHGHLWVSTDGGGLGRLDLDHIAQGFKRYRHDPHNPRSLAIDRVRVLYVDREGRLWVGTENGGLDLFDYRTETFRHHRHSRTDPNSLNNESLWAIYQDRTGNLWFGTFAGGLNVLKRNSQAIEHYRSVPGDPYSLNANAVSRFYEDPQATSGWPPTAAVPSLRPSHRSPLRLQRGQHHARTDAVFAMATDADGYLWVGGWAGGIGRFSPRQGRFLEFFNDQNGMLLTPHVFDALVDAQNRLWVANFLGGLVRIDLNTRQRKVYTPENSALRSNQILRMGHDPEGRLVLATQDAGVIVFDPRTETFTNYRHDPSSSNSLSNNSVLSILVADAHTLWVGTQYGLNRIDQQTGTVTRFFREDGLPSNTIVGLARDRQGFLWVATNRGLCRYNVQEKNLHPVHESRRAAGQRVQSLCRLHGAGRIPLFRRFQRLQRHLPGSLRAQHDPTSRGVDRLPALQPAGARRHQRQPAKGAHQRHPHAHAGPLAERADVRVCGTGLYGALEEPLRIQA